MRIVSVLLRLALIVLLAVVGIEIGIEFAPSLAARTGPGRSATVSGPESPVYYAAQPDWGGRLLVSSRSAAGIIDSVRAANEGNPSKTQTYTSPGGSFLLRQKSGADYAIAMAVPSPGKSNRSVLLDVPSAGHFRKELLPGTGDAEAPAADIPLCPQSRCRMQVGRGTVTFIGFYLTPDSVEAVRSFYVEALSRLGWQRVITGRPGFVETFTKRNADRTVVVQLRKQDSITTRIGLVATTSGRS